MVTLCSNKIYPFPRLTSPITTTEGFDNENKECCNAPEIEKRAVLSEGVRVMLKIYGAFVVSEKKKQPGFKIFL